MCDKRFQNRSVQHHRTHSADDETAQRAAGRVLGAEVTRLLAQAIRGESPAEVCHAGPTVTCTTCKGRAPRDDPALFTCSACSKAQHWTCGGLPAPPNRPLPRPKCVACLEHAGKSPSTLAALGRAMAEAYVRKRGLHVEAVQPDGWCLFRCVANATGLVDPVELLFPAAEAVLDRVDLSSLDKTTRDIVCSEAQQIRSRPEAAGRRVGVRWDSALWDFLPPALSAVTHRPLHIVSGNVRVTQTVVDLTAGGAEPIVLLRSAFEYGCDHYELAALEEL